MLSPDLLTGLWVFFLWVGKPGAGGHAARLHEYNCIGEKRAETPRSQLRARWLSSFCKEKTTERSREHKLGVMGGPRGTASDREREEKHGIGHSSYSACWEKVAELAQSHPLPLPLFLLSSLSPVTRSRQMQTGTRPHISSLPQQLSSRALQPIPFRLCPSLGRGEPITSSLLHMASGPKSRFALNCPLHGL